MNGNTKKKRCNTRKITRKYKRGRNASNRSTKNMSKSSFHLYNRINMINNTNNKNTNNNIIAQYGGNITIIEKIKDKYLTRKSWDEGIEKFSKLKENNITEQYNISTNVEVFNEFLKSIFKVGDKPTYEMIYRTMYPDYDANTAITYDYNDIMDEIYKSTENNTNNSNGKSMKENATAFFTFINNFIKDEEDKRNKNEPFSTAYITGKTQFTMFEKRKKDIEKKLLAKKFNEKDFEQHYNFLRGLVYLIIKDTVSNEYDVSVFSEMVNRFIQSFFTFFTNEIVMDEHISLHFLKRVTNGLPYLQVVHTKTGNDTIYAVNETLVRLRGEISDKMKDNKGEIIVDSKDLKPILVKNIDTKFDVEPRNN